MLLNQVINCIELQEAKKYFERQRYEHKLLEYIGTEFAITLTNAKDDTLERKVSG